MTLRAKLLAPILLVSALLIAFLFGSWMPAHLRETEESVRGDSQRHLATVADSFVPYLLARQLDAVYDVLDTMKRRNASWSAIELLAPDGTVLYPLDPVASRMAPGADEALVVQPIRVGTEELGRLAVLVDLHRELAEARRRHGTLVLVAVLAVAAYVGLLGFLLERNVRRPLAQLAEASKRLAAGSFDAPLDRAGAIEVQSLVDSFASMRAAIRGYRAEQAANAERERKLEQQLAQAQKMEALGTLAGGIAHDFNNVLSPIIGYTELARTHAADDPELSEDLAQVSEAAFRARDLVRQILTFSRKAEKRKAPLHVSTVAKEALKLLRSSIPSTIEIRQRYERDGQVFADPTQIHQVIMNLCTNAFHAMEARGGVLAVTVDEVEVTVERPAGADLPPGRYVVLAVSDTGVGMTRETQARIFDPYFTTKEKGKGTGLGLAVVDGIVRDHAGRISVYSEPGAGTTFKVYLPVSEHAAAGSVAPQEGGIATGTERILVVDDEESIRTVLAKCLRDAGYRVQVHGGAAGVLEALLRDPDACDLLITDMTMPGMDGKELARRVLELRPGLPVILCCGYSSLINAEEAARMGIRAYVEKPVVMRELLTRVREVLDEKATKVA